MADNGGPKPQKKTETLPPSRPSSKPQPPLPRKRHPEVIAAQISDILSALLVFRFINALCVRTFFQPDEYFQALEPAWSMAFGKESGAWLTWEWQHQLRSSLHPAIFGAAYKAVYTLMDWLEFYEPFRAFILVPLPKIIQSVFAGLGDFYTWRLATEIYGMESNVPWAALWMTVLNPWQWYCSTRTFSNSLETTLTIAALYYWPWELVKDAKADKTAALQSRRSVNSLRISLVLAAFAVILRPTNILVWLGILTITLTRFTLDGASPLQTSTLVTLTREVIFCGGGALALSVISDRLYFGFWAFPPYKWLYFNISQSLAVFYGRMPWHYYLAQGIPLLTTTFLPFVLIGLYKTTLSFSSSPFSPSALSTLQSNTLRTLAFTLLTMVGALSTIAHKEVRFLYPLLPVLHLLGAPYLVQFFTTPQTTPPQTTTPQTTTPPTATTPKTTLRHKLSLLNLLTLNLLLALYLSAFHQPAPLSVLAFLRADFERLHPDRLSFVPNTTAPPEELFALFLTPCHTTPWRSHLVYPSLRARALTCEPPLHTAPGSVEREGYLDEADRFYARASDGGYGTEFLAGEMWPALDNKEGGGKRGGEVPRYIVGFEGIEGVLEGFFGDGGEGAGMGVKLTRRWEGWNGLFNEDWRRGGRLVVWDTGVWKGGEGEE